MELKREQIVKALECCTLGDCYPCYYGCIGAGCRDEMCGDALALIKKLTERNEILEAKCKVNDRVGAEYIKVCEECANLNDKCASLTEENERLRGELERRRLIITTLPPKGGKK